jgi:hypothetical protein
MGGGGPSTILPQGKIDSVNGYNSQTASTRQSIIDDTSIDSVSKQELLNMLQYSNGIDPAHTGDDTADQIANVSAQLATDEGSDPLYVGRRNNEDQINAMIAQPGQLQTNLTDNNSTPMGTPTLLTSSANAAASSSQGPTAPSGGKNG